jgi:formamidopyrimidine-DNA glycosylase
VPEGHTIRRLRNDLDRHFGDGPITATSPQGRFAEGAAVIDQRSVDRFESAGKHLFGHFGNDILHVHLGLIGKFGPSVDGSDAQCRLRLMATDSSWDLRGPSTCSVISPDEHAAIRATLGPDPLGRKDDPALFVERIRATRKPIGDALLDQRRVAGIGNVYRAELCFLAGIRPTTPAIDVDETTLCEMWNTIRALMRRGVRQGRIITRESSEVGGPRQLARLDDDERVYVYHRDGEPCHRCGTEIRLVEVAQRKCWFCPECQPR